MNSASPADKKKEIEIHYLDRLRAAMSDFPEGRVEPTEEPDFLVHGANMLIGIELTELHQETRAGVKPQQALEAMRARVVKKAQEIYVASGLPPVMVSIFMNDNYDIKKDRVGSLAKEIFQLVAQNIPNQESSQEIENDWRSPTRLPDPVISMSVRRLAVITRTFFSSPGATWVSTISVADIERALIPKDRKYTTYRAKCDQAWLVINADMGKMSTWFDFDGSALSKTFRTQFDRVFILRHSGGLLLELPVVRP